MPPEVEKNLIKQYNTTLKYFDKLEDRTRHYLSQRPLLYALIAGVGLVMFWRGVWQIIDIVPLLHYPILSFVVSVLILLLTGTFVSFFIGDQILLSGLRNEKRVAEKTEREVAQEETELTKIITRLHSIEYHIKEINGSLSKNKTKKTSSKKLSTTHKPTIETNN